MNKSAILELNTDNQGFLLPRISDTTLINALAPPDGMVIFFSPAKQVMVRTNGYWKGLALKGNYITSLTGDVIANGPDAATASVGGIRGVPIPALSPGFLKYSGTAWNFDNTAYLSTTAATLQLVTTNGNTSDNGIELLQSTNSPINSFALKLRRANDNSPNGYLIRGMNKTGTADLFTVDAVGNLTGTSFVKTGGTASQFLKADGSVDNTAYLTGANVVFYNQANTYTAGMKQVFTSSATSSGFNISGITSDPGTLANGDIWMNSTSNLLKARLNGVTTEIVTNSGTQALFNKTISGTNNTFSNIPNTAILNGTIGLTLGSAGSDVNVSGSPASLGNALTLNLPSASASNRGMLTPTDWSSFNSKAPATGGGGYIQNQVSTNQIADMRISGKALVGGVVTDNGAALQVAGNTIVSGKIAIGNISIPNASLDVSGDVAMRTGALSAANGSNNDLSIGKTATFRISGPTAAFSITGISGGYDGRMIILYNSTDFVLTLKHDDVLSTDINRIYCSSNTSIDINKKGCATLLYSSADSRWIVVSTR